MKRVYLLIAATVLMCSLLIAAVFVPTRSSGSSASDLIVRAPAPTPDGMVWVPGGEFLMGTASLPAPDRNPDRVKPDEYPAHVVELDGFWMDQTEVTNRQFQEFVAMTGYKTFAEREMTRQDFAARGTDVSAFPEGVIQPGSMCFNSAFDKTQLVVGPPGWEYQVWKVVDGADWKHPDGPGSTIDHLMDHPVVHIAWEDAVAYCDWAGKRLPTEAEFEYASRSGGQDMDYPWGNEFLPNGKYLANFWQGDFPTSRSNEDGYLTTAPVKSYPPNSLGLYDIAGNVWEWCSDYYDMEYYSVSPRRNPKGPLASNDPQEPGNVKRVQRGGSFMCNVNNCTGYRTRARMRGDVASSSFHNGFRCVVDARQFPAFEAAQAKIAEWRKTQEK
ncbi:formylglycine-generating enzyme family protein [Planctomicrobium sp. SH664]|uniref:formylglycine-generating enzyme family protein n=1 Tax=Planctomicrobium sp. SH664 TaxID=3448125 RepID=UPI003F5B55EB